MYISDTTEKEFLKSLIKEREKDEKNMASCELNDACHFGLSFTEMFRDIIPSIKFETTKTTNTKIQIIVDDNDLPYHGSFMSKENIYGSFSDKIEIQVDVYERLKLIQQLEEARMGIWIFSAKGLVGEGLSTSTTVPNHLFDITNPDDCPYISKHLNDTFVATKELKHFVENKFRTDKEVFNCRSLWIARISILLAFIVGFKDQIMALIKCIKNITI